MAMTLRLTEKAEDDLAFLADRAGVSKQSVIVAVIAEAADRSRHEDRVRDASARGRARYADVLDRLGR